MTGQELQSRRVISYPIIGIAFSLMRSCPRFLDARLAEPCLILAAMRRGVNMTYGLCQVHKTHDSDI
jgi:hypothetical protein